MLSSRIWINSLVIKMLILMMILCVEDIRMILLMKIPIILFLRMNPMRILLFFFHFDGIEYLCIMIIMIMLMILTVLTVMIRLLLILLLRLIILFFAIVIYCFFLLFAFNLLWSLLIFPLLDKPQEHFSLKVQKN